MTEPTPTSWFDSLVHATPDGGWLGADRYDAGAERLIGELDRMGSWRACLVGIAGYCDDDYTLQLAAAHPHRFVPVAGVDPCADGVDLERNLASLAARGFRGIKLHPRLNGYDPMDPRVTECVVGAGEQGLVVFLDTLFRQRGRATIHPVDVIDHLVTATGAMADPTRLVALHGTGASLLELFELGRAHAHLLIDLSFTILRYAGSSIDDDIGFLCEQLDQRVVVGSDMPEYRPVEVKAHLDRLMASLPEEKQCNVLARNLDRLFPVPAAERAEVA